MATESTTVAANEITKDFGTTRLDPGMYVLSPWVSALPLKMDGKECHFGDAWDRLSQSKYKEVEQHGVLGGDIYVTETAKVQIKGEGIEGDGTRGLLHALLELHRKGIDPFAATWFPYDSGRYMGATTHDFFVLYEGKIVEEMLGFPNHFPLVLQRPAHYENYGFNHQSFNEATECYWYRKFYTETMRGQLMVLRPDKPPLYFFKRPTCDWTGDATLAVLTKLYYLLWVVIPILGAIAFPSLRFVMVIAAVLLLGLWALECRGQRVAREWEERGMRRTLETIEGSRAARPESTERDSQAL